MSKIISRNRYYYLLIAFIGVAASVSASGLYLLYLNIWNPLLGFLQRQPVYYFLFAFIALVASYAIVKLFAHTKTTGSGTHLVLERYHLSNGEISVRDTVTKAVASILTLGFGGSAGPEGPSLLVGGSIASNVSRRLGIRVHNLRRVFIAGAAAGLAAVFRTPLTGILFALEIPYRNDLDMETFIEAMVASIPSYLIAVLILGSERIFGNPVQAQLSLMEIFLSLVLGLICGVYAIFFTRVFSGAEQIRTSIRKKAGDISVLLLGTVILGVCGYFSIYSIGVGIHFVDAIINGTSFTVAMILAIVLVKTLSTAITLNFGGSGGLFFPTIVIGAGIGFLFSSVTDANLKIVFAAVGMAALLSGTHKILLTPTAFVVETLGGVYAIPALLASGVSYLVSGNASFYPIQPRTKLKAEELALEEFYAKAKMSFPDQLDRTLAASFMTKDPVSVYDGVTIKEAIEAFEKTTFRVLPVVDDYHRIVGVVTMEDLGNLNPGEIGGPLSERLMLKPVVITREASLKDIAELMLKREEDHVFIVDENDRVIGTIAVIDVVRKIMELSTF
ncbi:MAG TPA: chloride channel protein [Acidobacteriota bacterium]|nr:chloride channel protein [Acidobacteriota bacterium]